MRSGLASVLAVVAAVAMTGTARAEVLDDNPAAASRGPGQITVFLRGNNGALLISDLANGAFTPWRSLGGYLDSGPGAAGRTPRPRTRSCAAATARSTSSRSVRGRWSGWIRHGAPDAVRADRLRPQRQRHPRPVLARRRQRHRGQSWVPGTAGPTSTTRSSTRASTLSAPAAVSRNSGQVDVIVRGTNDHVYLNAYNGSAWSGWAEIPGGM